MDTESVKNAIRHKGLSMTQVANRSDQAYVNLANKLRRGGLGLSGERELNRFADALEAKYYSFFEFPDGKRFGTYPDQATQNRESDLVAIEVEGLDFPIYKPQTIWVKASDIFNTYNIQNTSLEDWVDFRFRYENENRNLMGRAPLQEEKDYIKLDNDWLLSLDLASAIEPTLWKLKETL